MSITQGGKLNESKNNRIVYNSKKEGKNLTQQQLAEKLGVSNKTVSKWETGDSLR